MSLQHFAATGEDDLGNLRREEATQPVEALELRHLALHPLFERTVPLGKLSRLGLDGVVVLLDPQQGTHPAQQL